MMGGAKAQYDGIKAFSETDFTDDLKIIDVPTLVMHGDDDQIVPIADSAPLSAKLLKNGRLKVYEVPTWHVHDARGCGQSRSARLHQELNRQP
jgi:pimeloyl-ACP methyl ester carboxylesterase